jgi:alkylation response protein AidB-like acyl-CoA dehydrogenase
MALKMRCITDDETLVQDAAMEFCAAYPPSAFARPLRDGSEALMVDFWREFSALGFPGLRVEHALGGTGFGHVAAGQIAEALGRNAIPSPFVATTGVGCELMIRGDRNRTERYLRAINAGSMRLAMALDETGRHAPDVVTTIAERVDHGWSLTGQKRVVCQSIEATHLLVSARIAGSNGEADQTGTFLVTIDQAGVTLNRRVNLDGSLGADVSFKDACAAADDVLTLDQGDLAQALDVGRAYLSAELLGLAEECFARTLEFLKQREQFGVRLSSFQALQHRCAQLYADLQLARSATLAALLALDNKAVNAPLIVAVAKSKVGRVAKLVAHEAMQLHGGISMTDAFDLHFFTKRIWVCDAALGDDAYHTERVAQLLGY